MLFNRRSGLAEVVIPPRSGFIGQSVFPGMVTSSGDLIVLAIQRRGEVQGPDATVLAEGDSLLLQGTWKALDERLDHPDILVVHSPELIRRQAVPMGRGAKQAIGVLLAMVALLIRGKINLLSEMLSTPIRTRLCVTHMDRIRGYSEFARFLCKHRLPLTIEVGTDTQTSLVAALQAYEKYVPRALTTLPVGAFEASISLLSAAEAVMTPDGGNELTVGSFNTQHLCDDPNAPLPTDTDDPPGDDDGDNLADWAGAGCAAGLNALLAAARPADEGRDSGLGRQRRRRAPLRRPFTLVAAQPPWLDWTGRLMTPIWHICPPLYLEGSDMKPLLTALLLPLLPLAGPDLLA